MLLQDIYNQLSFGELRLLFMGSDPDNVSDGLPQDSFIKMLPHIQLGITALHKRFELKESQVTITRVGGQDVYVLTPGKALPKAWANDLLQIKAVYGEFDSCEYEIPLNNSGYMDSIRTIAFNTLQLPDDTEKAPWLLETTNLRVVYRANHPKIDSSIANAAPLITEIHLPDQYLEPLCYYVASRLYNPVGMTPGAMHEGNNFFQKYEMACQQLTDQGYEIKEDEYSDRFEQAGWA